MKRFALLMEELDKTNKANAKIMALARYFREEQPQDSMWAIAMLVGERPKRPIKTTLLRSWAAEAAGIPDWLFEESYHEVGDLAETIALLVQKERSATERTLGEWVKALMLTAEMEEMDKKDFVLEAWRSLDYYEKFVFNKLITGGFRIGVSTQMVVKALAKITKLEENVLTHRLSGKWSPDTLTFDELTSSEDSGTDASKPYPFCLAYPLEAEGAALENIQDWLVELKWDGIRGQLVKRQGKLFLWSRGGELITDKFPEYESFSTGLPDGTALDGEILPMRDGLPMDFNDLQQRIGRKSVTKKMMEAIPVHFMAYDLIEWQGNDIRMQPLVERRRLLENLVQQVNHPYLLLSVAETYQDWPTLQQAYQSTRERKAEGFMLKHKDSPYHTGRKKGEWWKWKQEPMTIDAVLIYAMAGHGRRANLYTDYTFAVWKGESLVPFTKAYSGLTDQEFVEVDAFVRKNTVEKFGPVRSVRPELVFEIAFESIQQSTRHKSGYAVRFPRMKRWRKDKSARDANTFEDLEALFKGYGK